MALLTKILAALGIPSWLFFLAVAGGVLAWLEIRESAAYNRGYAAAKAHYEKLIADERAAQGEAIAEAVRRGFELWEKFIAAVEERNELLAKIAADAEKDPDARKLGISRDSVRRINDWRRKIRPKRSGDAAPAQGGPQILREYLAGASDAA